MNHSKMFYFHLFALHLWFSNVWFLKELCFNYILKHDFINPAPMHTDEISLYVM